MDVLSTPDLMSTFVRLNDLLIQIQKALGEYLERQRAAFPRCFSIYQPLLLHVDFRVRFYFVGDEDLLDIVGSGQDARKMQSHMKKMFVGIAQLALAEEGAVITGMIAPEGEHVKFERPIMPKIFKKLGTFASHCLFVLSVTTMF